MAHNIGTLRERLANAQLAGVDQMLDVRVVGPGNRKYAIADITYSPEEGVLIELVREGEG